tara:strand:+ start:75 stop:329 length:255 start_codon:yes stop_codon:yes gene_type:complete
MNELKIEKNIPMPAMGRKKFSRLIEEMDVGDSILFTDDNTGFKTKYADSMCNSLITALKRNGMKGCKRRMNNVKPEEWRVWRTE